MNFKFTVLPSATDSKFDFKLRELVVIGQPLPAAQPHRSSYYHSQRLHWPLTAPNCTVHNLAPFHAVDRKIDIALSVSDLWLQLILSSWWFCGDVRTSGKSVYCCKRAGRRLAVESRF